MAQPNDNTEQATLRDQFAMAAMAEISRQCSLSSKAELDQMADARGGAMPPNKLVALCAYEMADAMMAAREGKP